MTIALRGMVELYRRAGRVMDVHRCILGYSISHDDKSVRIYGHYPEINGESVNYYRYCIRAYDCRDQDGADRWTSYAFVHNLYTQFAPKHMERIKEIIDLLPEPPSQSLDTETNLDDPAEFDSQEVLSTAPTSQQDHDFIKPGPPNTRVTNAALKQQLLQQHEEAKVHEERLMSLLQQREATLVMQLEQQRKEAEQQRKEAEQQRKEAEQQRKESEQQRKESEQQRKDLVQLMKEQSEQIKELLKAR